MAGETVWIDELVLRVPGLSRDEARSLGQDVARQLADRVPDQGRSQALGALMVPVRISGSSPASQMAPTIADRIVEGIQR